MQDPARQPNRIGNFLKHPLLKPFNQTYQIIGDCFTHSKCLAFLRPGEGEASESKCGPQERGFETLA